MEARSSLELARLLVQIDPVHQRDRAVDLARAAALTGDVLESAWLVRSAAEFSLDSGPDRR